MTTYSGQRLVPLTPLKNQENARTYDGGQVQVVEVVGYFPTGVLIRNMNYLTIFTEFITIP